MQFKEMWLCVLWGGGGILHLNLIFTWKNSIQHVGGIKSDWFEIDAGSWSVPDALMTTIIHFQYVWHDSATNKKKKK